MPRMTNGDHADIDLVAPAPPEQPARRQAIEQIQRRRHFRVNVGVSGLAMLTIVVIWAISEYNNAAGWPTDGFSQSSSIPHVWNVWIIYPLLAWVFYVGTVAWATYLRKPISEKEIQHEIERQAGGPPR
jgi:2TM domain